MSNQSLKQDQHEDHSITLLVNVDILPEHYPTARLTLKTLAEKTRNESGSIFYNVFESTTKPNCVIIYERWRDPHALETHMSQSYLREFLEISRPWLVKEISSIELHEIR